MAILLSDTSNSDTPINAIKGDPQKVVVKFARSCQGLPINLTSVYSIEKDNGPSLLPGYSYQEIRQSRGPLAAAGWRTVQQWLTRANAQRSKATSQLQQLSENQTHHILNVRLLRKATWIAAIQHAGTKFRLTLQSSEPASMEWREGTRELHSTAERLGTNHPTGCNRGGDKMNRRTFLACLLALPLPAIKLPVKASKPTQQQLLDRQQLLDAIQYPSSKAIKARMQMLNCRIANNRIEYHPE